MPDSAKEQRRQPRFLCSALVTLHWQNGRAWRKATVLLENISAFGACLQAEFGLPGGARVRIACGRKSFRGVVRYCLLRVGGWFIGVELDADSRWSKAKYLPQHLLDPRKVRPRDEPRVM
jgi:hypothetical protein